MKKKRTALADSSENSKNANDVHGGFDAEPNTRKRKRTHGDVKMPVVGAVVLPIVKGGYKWKRCRCQGHPAENVCTLTSVVGVPPAHRLLKVVKREQKFIDMLKEDKAISLQCLNEVVGDLDLEGKAQKLLQSTAKSTKK